MKRIKIFDDNFEKLINLYSDTLEDYSNIILENIRNHKIVFSWSGGIKYITITQKVNGRYCKRYYAYKKTKKRGEQIIEVVRKVEGFKHVLVNYNTYRNYYAGYVINFNYMSKKWDALDTFGPSEIYDITNYEELIANDKEIKYCGYTNKSDLEFIEYITYFRHFPKIEILSKLNIDYIVRYYYLLNLNGKTMSEILKLPNEWVDQVLKRNVSYLNAKKYHKINIVPGNKNQIRTYEWFYYNFTKMVNLFKPIKSINKIIKVYNYIQNQKLLANETEYNIIQTYRDYLNTAQFLEKDLTDNYWLFPKKLHEQENELLEERQIKEELFNEEKRKKIIKDNALLNRKIKSVAKKVAVNLQSKEVTVLVAKDMETIMTLGDKLNICVGRLNMDYMENMSNKKNLILFAYDNKDNNVLECIEYDWKENKIIQSRGKNNSDSNKHKFITQLLNNFTDKMKNYTGINLFQKNCNIDFTMVL